MRKYDWRQRVRDLGYGRSELRTLGRGLLLAALVGVIAGIAALLLSIATILVQRVALERLAGYEQEGPANEIEVPLPSLEPVGQAAYHLTPWMLVLLPAVGGLISGGLTKLFRIEHEGHGTGAAIEAYHQRRGYIPIRVPLVRLVTSSITLGTGGSGGREGPIAQIAAGFGSFLATHLRLTDSERRVLMAAGMGAGIGAIFHAPLAGAMFAIEVLYRDPDFEAEALIPSFIATTIAYAVYSLAYGLGGFHPLFEVGIDLTQTRPLHLIPPLAVLAVAMSLLSLVYVTTLHRVEEVFSRLPWPYAIKAGVGGLLTGAVAVGLYYAVAPWGEHTQHDALSVLSYGYGFLQEVLAGEIPTDASAAVTILLVVGLGKILTTALTIGSGGSGGTFGPSMVIGASCGAVVGVVMHRLFPSTVQQGDLVVFAILGMAGFFAAAANTPVGILIMVSELTNSYALLLPSMWVCALAYLISRSWTLYPQQVANRLESPAHRGDFVVDVLKGMSVGEVITEAHRRFVTVKPETPLDELSRMITSTLQSSFPVVENGEYRGLFSLADIRQFLFDAPMGSLAVAEDLADTRVAPLTLRMDLSDAIARFAQGRFDELPVVADVGSREVLALLRRQDVIAAYNRRLLERRGEERVVADAP